MEKGRTRNLHWNDITSNYSGGSIEPGKEKILITSHGGDRFALSSLKWVVEEKNLKNV